MNKKFVCLAELSAGLSIIIVFAACGAIHVDGNISGGTTNTVTGSGTITVVPPSSAFLPFFGAQCESLQPGQLCYNTDVTACAQCLATALEASLGGVIPSPIPSPQAGG